MGKSYRDRNARITGKKKRGELYCLDIRFEDDKVPRRRMNDNGPKYLDRKSKHANNFCNIDSDDESERSEYQGHLLPLHAEKMSCQGRKDRLEKCIEVLYEKRSRERSKALEDLVKAFQSHVLIGAVENIVFTLSERFISSIKGGSVVEIPLASHALGLLALTVGPGSQAHEILEDSILPLTGVIGHGTSSKLKRSVIESLSMLTFVGGDDDDGTEKSMKIIWALVESMSSSCDSWREDDFTLIGTLISAWSFLLSILDNWRINSKTWQGSMSILLGLLDLENKCVSSAVHQALALIFEMDSVEKFSTVANGNYSGMVVNEHERYLGRASFLKDNKLKISHRLGDILKETSCSQSQRKEFQSVASFMETGEFEVIIQNVRNDYLPLRISSWGQYIQWKFLRNFLDKGYQNHIQNNVFLHNHFNLQLKGKEKSYILEKRLILSTESMSLKEKTKYLNKCRRWNQENMQGHFVVDMEN